MSAPLTLVAGRLGGAAVVGIALASAAPWRPAVLAEPLIVLGVGLFLLVFATVYAAMARRLPSAGALYTFAARGLGRPFGLSAAWLALTAYTVVQLGLYAVAGVAVAPLIDGPWWMAAGVAWAVVTLSGILRVEITAAVLALLVIGLLGLTVRYPGADWFTGLGPPALTDIPRPELGLALLTAALAFAGFETAAAYGEDLRRSAAPVAYPVLVVLVVVLAPPRVALPAWGVAAGALAGVVALHHTIVRYLVALGRERVFPRGLARLRLASLTQSVVAGLTLGACVLFDVDLSAGFITAGGLGVLVLLLGTSLAALLFLNRHPAGEGVWRRLLAPGVATVGFGTLGWLGYEHHRPLLIAGAVPVLVGLVHAGVLRQAGPVVYAGIGLGGRAIVVVPDPSTEPVVLPHPRVPGAHRPERVDRSLT
ncbi:amino acid permease [Actinoplanes sp. NPDC051494]|uniref:amino acid permease n=1 Tax=Actinoplanes sp. NPDC051494 TaxID=3363907 RepID=UPI003788CC29